MSAITPTVEIGHRLPETGRAAWLLGNVSVERVSGAQSDGRFAMIDSLVPLGSSPPLHVHTREDEIFYVLDGQVACTLDGEELQLGPGESVYLARGLPHTYRALTPVARWLTLVSPAGFEEFFFEFGEPAQHRGLPPAQDGPPDIERLVTTLKRYGVTLAG